MIAAFACVAVAVSLEALSSAHTPVQPPPSTQAPETDREKFPEGAGKATLFKVCGTCHGPESVLGTLRTRQEWSDVIDQMAMAGAQASDQEYDEILAYLVRNFSPIPINKATAKVLETTLDVPASIAEAIVTYRQAKGDFTSVDDLKKVPGLESSKIEARRDRLVF
jgi:competence protein ComEA